MTKKNYVLLNLVLLFVASATLFSCSDKGDVGPRGTHHVNLYPIGIGLNRINDTKIFVSEKPYESYATFQPLASVDVPENRTVLDSVVVDVSAHVGKTLYFVALRKHLLSDGYYNITANENGHKLSDNKLTIEPEKTTYQLLLTLREPKAGEYTSDKARLMLTVRKGNAAMPNTTVYWAGTTTLWSDAIKKTIEDRYFVDQTVAKTVMGLTKANGTLSIDIPVNEFGTSGSGDNVINTNEHVFFVIDNGKVHPIIVKVDALQLSKTLQI